MLFSSKISNSVLNFLEARGYSLESLLASTEIPEEFLRDPSSWIEVDKMEEFLRLSEREFLFSKHSHEDPAKEHDSNFADDSSTPFLVRVGHAAKDLRSWGVLDGVIRMMQNPQHIFAQPDRLLSYFISPPPPLAEIQRLENTLSFRIPISSEEYPLTSQYMRAAYEALPIYVGQSHAKVSWDVNEFKIEWNQDQGSLFQSDDPGRVISPNSAQELLEALERAQRELETKNQELLKKQYELGDLRAQAIKSKRVESSFSAQELEEPIQQVLGDLARMNDYFSRALQLVTILVGQNRKTPQVQEAMRRVDWEIVSQQYSLVAQKVSSKLETMREKIKAAPSVKMGEISEHKKVRADLNKVVEKSLSALDIADEIQVDTHLLMDRDVAMFPEQLGQALSHILSRSVQMIEANKKLGAVSDSGDSSEVDKRRTMRVSARPRGNWAEIEISDTGVGMNEKEIQQISEVELQEAQSIVKMHEGFIRVSSQPGRGSTFLIDLPMI